MSRGEHSIFDTSEEAALTLEVVAKGMINVDEFPYDMRNGTHKVILEASSCILLKPQAKESSASRSISGQVIHNSFGKKMIFRIREMNKKIRTMGKKVGSRALSKACKAAP